MPVGSSSATLTPGSDVGGAAQAAAAAVARVAGVIHRVANVVRHDVGEANNSLTTHPEAGGLLGDDAVAQALHGALAARRLRRRLLAALAPPSAAHGPTSFAPVIMPPFPDMSMPSGGASGATGRGGPAAGGGSRSRGSASGATEAAAKPPVAPLLADAAGRALAASQLYAVLSRLPAAGVSACALQASCGAAAGPGGVEAALNSLAAAGAIELQRWRGGQGSSTSSCMCGAVAACPSSSLLARPVEPVASYARGLLQRAAGLTAAASASGVPAGQVGLLSDPPRHATVATKLQTVTWFQTGFLPLPPPAHRAVNAGQAAAAAAATPVAGGLATSASSVATAGASMEDSEAATPVAASAESASASGYPLVPGQRSFFPAQDGDAARALLGFLQPSPPMPTVADAFNAGGGGPERLLGEVEGRGVNAAYASFLEWLPPNLRLKGYGRGAAGNGSEGQESTASLGAAPHAGSAAPSPTGWVEASVTPHGFMTDLLCRALAHVQVTAGSSSKRGRAVSLAVPALESAASPLGGGVTLAPAALATYGSSCAALSGAAPVPPKPLSRVEAGDAALAQEILDDKPLAGALTYLRTEDTVVAVRLVAPAGAPLVQPLGQSSGNVAAALEDKKPVVVAAAATPASTMVDDPPAVVVAAAPAETTLATAATETPLAPLPAGDVKPAAAAAASAQRKRGASTAVGSAAPPRAARRLPSSYVPTHHGVSGDAGPLDDPSARWRCPSVFSALGNGAGLAGPYICRQAYYTSPSNPGDCPPHVSSKPLSWAKDVMPLFKLVSGPTVHAPGAAPAASLAASPSYGTGFPGSSLSPSVFASPAASPAHFGAGLASIPGLAIPPPREDAFSVLSSAGVASAHSPLRSPALTGSAGPSGSTLLGTASMSSGGGAGGLTSAHSFLRLQRYDSGVDQNPAAASGSLGEGDLAPPLLEVPATPRPGESLSGGIPTSRLLLRNVIGSSSSGGMATLPHASLLAAPNCRDLGPSLALGTERQHLFPPEEAAALPPVRLWATRVVNPDGSVEFTRPESAWDRWPTRQAGAAAAAAAPAPAAASELVPAAAPAASAAVEDADSAASSADELEDEEYARLHTAVFDRIKARLQAVHEAVTKELKEKAAQKAVAHYYHHGVTPAVGGGGARQRLGSVVSSPVPRRASTGGNKARAMSQDPLALAPPAIPVTLPAVPLAPAVAAPAAAAPPELLAAAAASEEAPEPPAKRPRLATEASDKGADEAGAGAAAMADE